MEDGTFLERITASTKERVEQLKRDRPMEALRTEAEAVAAELDGERPFPFERALSGPEMAFICEVKKASPSRGILSEAFPYLEIARAYKEAGAACISVLTEPDHFLGSDRYLAEIRNIVPTPLLRKDFVVDEYQIHEARVLGADAVLLICAILDDTQLMRYLAICDRLRLDALVEVHTERELRMALAAGARIVGINNRDLSSFRTDVETTLALRPLLPPEVICVSESGISTAEDIRCLSMAGVDAVLIGEALMRSGSIAATLAALRNGAGAEPPEGGGCQ